MSPEIGVTQEQYQDIRTRKGLLDMGHLDTEVVHIGEAGVHLSSGYLQIEVAPDLQEDRNRTVAVYFAGLPQNPRQTDAQHPQEVPLTTELLRRNCTDFILLKADGTNRAAYVNPDGKITGDIPVQAAYEKLLKIFADHNIDPRDPHVQIRMYGYSEGGAQGAGVTRHLLQEGINIRSFSAYEASGLTGYETPEEAHLLPQKPRPLEEYPDKIPYDHPAHHVQRTSYGLRLTKDLIQSYRNASIVPASRPGLKGHIHGAVTLSRRMLGFLDRFLPEKATSALTGNRPITPERFKLAWSRSQVFDDLVSAGIPVTFFAGTRSPFVSIPDAIDRVEAWKQKPGSNVNLVVADFEHFDPYSLSGPIGLAMAFAEDSFEKQPQEEKAS